MIIILYSLATMSPLGWQSPHLVDNTDTQYLGEQHWQQCWCFRFCFFFVSICLRMCQSVFVSVHLFRINLKFLKTHKYWLAQLLYLSLVSGLLLETWRMHLKMLRSSSKKSWYGNQCHCFRQKNLYSNLNSCCCYDYYHVLAGNNAHLRDTPSTSSG